MIAHLCGLEPGRFIHCMGGIWIHNIDTHIYKNHFDAINVQISRTPKPFPKLRIKIPSPITSPEIKSLTQNQIVDRLISALEMYEYDDLEVIGYDPHPKIQMDMSV